MALYLVPVLFALLVWWLSTGLVLYLDGLPQRTYRWSLIGATALLAPATAGLVLSSGDASVGGAYVAFTSALLIWAWHEITFLMGLVTGPWRAPCPPGCRGWRRLGYAVGAVLWHELAIAVSGVAIVALTWDGANQVGTWTFVILWVMRVSAKLNVYLGVPNLSEQFLPDHLDYLKTFLGRRPMNLLFPASVTLATIALALLVGAAGEAATPFEATGYALLAAMLGLAILEHWFLVLPLPDAALWSWALRSRRRDAEAVGSLTNDREPAVLAAGRA